MAKSSIKIRAKAKGDVTTVKTLMTHPMETGGRKDKKTGKLIPAHFIQEITCKHKGNTVIAALFSGGVSKNPYLSFKFTGGAKGDEIELSWSDNKGGSDSKVAKIK
ncbi:thiosulfate oxidation carrier complex protein SoxZ [Candidatus Endoriftia persephone]|jgi:sulfur-oxidizing protein SoxZ|uniref:Sulfur oxidation protein SoxZ n=3 Tax=Gammaproteobacteria TaxID=1236 RepID=G2FHP4_9GAMM|nr:thiosulfate oxidation carrier complex protein SoxZ [Candidatus Endoriftia persephone]EGV52246.1 sulfur oxidation protein SoxZ [endosymbiont of Riftia pachyptila (vent Ph05)]EGW53688.1 sulfur oxidation protein SoxZ [endosymbiont of Tevnia jerichonana (vent Tica)]USF86904.1 thiosulfate oxidation carrier complex protein SoxZ [Candidatus Endoriftia persephone]